MKSGEQLFEEGYAKYMSSNCAEALEPLYESSLKHSKNQDRARLYLAHCQSIFAQNSSAAYNLKKVNAKNLGEEDSKLYHQLVKTHQAAIDAIDKIYVSIAPYYGQSTYSPSSTKGTGNFYGGSLGAAQATWSLGLFYEGYSVKLNSGTSSSYSQTMMGLQAGYLVLPSWHISGSYTQISGSTDQFKNISVLGIQTDYYFTPLWSAFLEYYSSKYPDLVYNLSSKSYSSAVTAGQTVAGLNFPIYNGTGWGVNGTASYTSIAVSQPTDSTVVQDANLQKNASRTEVLLSSYFGATFASLTYWSGSEVLGVRARGASVNNSSERHKNGVKLGGGYTFNPMFTLGASYGQETYNAPDNTGTYTDFKANTGVINATVTL